jgi:hypothetical protein
MVIERGPLPVKQVRVVAAANCAEIAALRLPLSFICVEAGIIAALSRIA